MTVDPAASMATLKNRFHELTADNPKIAKGAARGVLTAVLHLLPADEYPKVARARGEEPVRLTRTLCAFAGTCRGPCLNTAGRGGIAMERYVGTAHANNVQHGRYNRTRRYDVNPDAFLASLVADAHALATEAARIGYDAAIRLNGTSDLDWQALHPEALAAFPAGVHLYDYTKDAARVERGGRVHHTYSLDAGAARELTARRLLASGRNVAAVFAVKRGRPLPSTWRGYPVVDGDETDLRYLDPAGVVVGLRAKGPAVGDTSGFVRDPVTGDAIRAAAPAPEGKSDERVLFA